MYLKSISIRNYRKFGDSTSKIEFAHCTWPNSNAEQNHEGKMVEELISNDEQYQEKITEEYISKSSTLMVGKNNSGKTTILSLLKALKDKKCGALDAFKYTDFNLNYLRNWYESNILVNSPEDIKKIPYEELPLLEFNLEIAINDQNDIIGKFEDILVLKDVKTTEKQKVGEEGDIANINIHVKYEINNKTKFLESLSQIAEDNKVQVTKLGLSSSEIAEIFQQKGLEEISIQELKIYKDADPLINKFIGFYEENNFRKYLQHFCGKYYVLNFYSPVLDEPAKNFSLSSILKVKTIDANTVKDGKTLSNAYNKIVSTYIKNNETEELNEFIYQLNYQVKNTVDEKITDILQDAVTSIESAKNLQMNLNPAITLQSIFNHNIIYEYQENGNYIPENQFGLGYTNLMVIIAEIVDYIALYSEEDINGSINILCIEEPESFMHPQMQELFIKNISKAIAKLLGNKNKKKLDTFQIIITTHSSSILNSKIHSGNTLDNISYLGCDNQNQVLVHNIKDIEIINAKKNNKDSSKVFEYIKKYLRLEASDIFYADAVILVEGVSEETYLRYLIDQDEVLNNHHIKVYRIDGAYAHQFTSLLDLLKIKTIIFTDLDLKRTEDEKKVDFKQEVVPQAITDLSTRTQDNSYLKDGCLTTNGCLTTFIKEKINNEKDEVNQFIIDNIGNNEFLRITQNNVSLFTQGKINGNYATSFEESIILTNANESNKSSLIKLLQYTRPRTEWFKSLNSETDLISLSYTYQILLSDVKSKFSTGLLYLDNSDEQLNIQMPVYIEKGLNELKNYFLGETNE